MHRWETIVCEAEVTGFEGWPAQPTGRGKVVSTPYPKGETLGRLYGATLTERVMVYLERYDQAAYGL